MTKKFLILVLMVMTFTHVNAADKSKGKGKKSNVIEIGGMSIIGNRELPKSLYIVPWKETDINSETDLSRDLLNENVGVVDQEEFTRQLNYYELSK